MNQVGLNEKLFELKSCVGALKLAYNLIPLAQLKEACIAEELKKAMAVSKEKIQERSRMWSQFPEPSSFQERAETMATRPYNDAGKSGKSFQEGRNFPKAFQQRVLDSHSLQGSLSMGQCISGHCVR